MKLKLAILALVLAVFCLPPSTASAQSYTIDWYKIAGGGGTSTGGTYVVSGTIGQRNYAVTGGFWALIQVVQTPGAPTLYVSHAGNVVTVYWQDVAGWNLRQDGNLATSIASWPYSSTPTLTGGTNYLNLTNTTGNVFFRLSNP
jgi:hypothetical protein